MVVEREGERKIQHGSKGGEDREGGMVVNEGKKCASSSPLSSLSSETVMPPFLLILYLLLLPNERGEDQVHSYAGSTKKKEIGDGGLLDVG